MMKESSSKAMALLVTLLMIGSTAVVMIPTATKAASVTNNNAPEVLVLPGAENVLVANFTISGTSDVTIVGNKPFPGTELTTTNPWSDVYFYDDGDGVWDDTKDAIWQDDGKVYYDDEKDTHLAGATTENALGAPDGEATDWSQLSYIDAVDGDDWNASADTIFVDANNNDTYDAGEEVLAGVTPSDGTPETGDGVRDPEWVSIYTHDENNGDAWNPTVDIIWQDDGNIYYDDGFDDIIAGVSPPENTPANTTNPWASAEQPVVFYDDGIAGSDGAWNEIFDWIGIDKNNSGIYDGDLLRAIMFKNTGTATSNEISSIRVWEDNGDNKFNAGEDRQYTGTLIPITDHDKEWRFNPSSVIELDGTHRIFVTVDIASMEAEGFRPSHNSIQMQQTLMIYPYPYKEITFTNEKVQHIAILGVTYFEGIVNETYIGPKDFIITDTAKIKKGATVDLEIDTSKLTSGETYYLYYPVYVRSENIPYTYELQWKHYKSGSEPVAFTANGENVTLHSILFDRSGMWLLEDNNPSDIDEGDNDFAYFWVNGTEVYELETNIPGDEIYYGENKTIEILVKKDGKICPAYVEVRNEEGELVFYDWAYDGSTEFKFDWDLWGAGNYTVKAYYDTDPTSIGYIDHELGLEGYSPDFGYPILTADNYTGICGPWDPPENVSAEYKIEVKTGEPQLEIPEANRTMYWNFSGEVKIYVKGYDGKNLTVSDFDVKVYNQKGEDVTDNITDDDNGYIDKTKPGVIRIGCDNWGVDPSTGHVWGKEGTWKVVVRYNDAEGTEEEWNGTVTFTVTSAPDVQIKILNPEDKEIKAVPCDPENPFFDLRFSVINKNHESLGGEGGEEAEKAEKNITIYGDALFIGEEGKTLAEYKKICPFAVDYTPPSDGGDGVWSVKIIPLMDINGGEIKIKVNWENTTKEETIQVGGTKLNGTIVTITPSEFTIDENVTLTVKVTDANGYAYPNAYLQLFYFNDSATDAENSIIIDKPINWTNGGGTTSGEYTFLFNVSQQTDNQTDIFGEVKAPRYIIARAWVPNVGWGYAYAVMKPRSDLKVEISRDTFMAGKPYHFWINVSKIDPITGNKTGAPDETNLHVRIYNETGADVTSKFEGWGWSHLDGENSIEITSGYALEAGTYTIYAYNNTHDSEGYNATIYVVPVQVTCDKSEFIWGVDDNITATFTVTWQGQPVNGTLTIYNITDVGTYNKTWTNYTEDSSNKIDNVRVVNGVATLHNITAEYLPEGKGSMDITFAFEPEDGHLANASGVVKVKVPDVEPTPSSVALGETATVHVLVTGRGQPLSGVNVTLKGAGIELNATTGTNGVATFSFLPGSTGFIDILIENRSTGTKIEVTSHFLQIDVPPSVQEGTFIVNVTDENGYPVEGAYVKFTGTGQTKITDASGQVSFEISIPGTVPYATYKLIATKPGYKSDEESITIMNIFNLYISVPSKVSSGQKITVKVTSDAGQVYGVKITLKKGNEVIETKTLTGPEGVSFTIPQVKEKTTFTIVAEKEGYKSATYDITVTPGGIPGFELVTLIAAIGVAFVLLRRRQQ